MAAQQGIEDDLAEALAGDERVREAVQKDVDAANEKLARVEQIKKFTIVEQDWVPGGDELTPTMKLKRKPIAAEVRGGDRGAVPVSRVHPVSLRRPAAEFRMAAAPWRLLGETMPPCSQFTEGVGYAGASSEASTTATFGRGMFRVGMAIGSRSRWGRHRQGSPPGTR